MTKVFIIHGFQGSPNGGWRPWLMAQLEKRGVYACALAMPAPNDPVPREWVREITRHVEGSPRDRIFLVGHSLGVPAILRYLETAQVKNVEGLVLVSGPFFRTSKKKVDAFLKQPFACERIRSAVKHVTIIHGDDDRLVSPDQAAALAEALKGKLIMVKKGGHLNGSAGWLELPQCLKALETMLDWKK